MAETETRTAQDIGQDEAYTVNLKDTVATEKDVAGRTRGYYDMAMANLLGAQAALNSNYVTSIAALNTQVVAIVKQGLTTAGKNDENTIGVNETDHVVGAILNSPWAEAMKTIATAAVAEAQKAKT